MKKILLISILLTFTSIAHADKRRDTIEGFIAFGIAFNIGDAKDIRDVSNTLYNDNTSRKKYQTSIRTSGATVFMPKIKVNHTEIIFYHTKSTITIDFRDVKKGLLYLNKQKISFADALSQPKVFQWTSKVLSTSKLGSKFYINMYAYLLRESIYPAKQMLKKERADWRFGAFYDFVQAKAETLARTRNFRSEITTIELKCRARKLGEVKKYKFNQRSGLEFVTHSLKFHLPSQGYVYRDMLTRCATYLTDKGIVKNPYPGCPKPGTDMFSGSPFFSFPIHAASCCKDVQCEAQVRTLVKAFKRKWLNPSE